MSGQNLRQNRPILARFTMIKEFQVVKLLGQGGYGDVYEVKNLNTHEIFALKTEYLDATKHGLKNEIDIISKLDQPCFPSIIDSGETENCLYFVMKKYGMSVGAYRRQLSSRIIHGSIVFPIAIEMLKIIQKLHRYGFLHRDIKPSNFLFQMDPANPLSLIDFGLSVQHIDPNTNQPYPAGKPRFCGTKKYISKNIHEGRDFGRCDDLMSWFYSLVEMYFGRLPWASLKDKTEVGDAKTNISTRDLCKSMPEQCHRIYQHIVGLAYEEEPKYQFLINQLENARYQSFDTRPFNWRQFYNNVHNIDDTSEIPVERPETVELEGNSCCCRV